MMDDQRPMPESLATSTTEQITEMDGILRLRPDFDQLFRDIVLEAAECLDFLTENPDHAVYRQGTVLTSYLLNPDIDVPLEDALIPQYNENVRMWPIPGTPVFLTDMAGDIVALSDDSDIPYVIDLLQFDTKAELEQLLAGLRALRS